MRKLPSQIPLILLMAWACSGEGVLHIVRKEGYGALFRGIGPNVARAVLMNASQLAT